MPRRGVGYYLPPAPAREPDKGGLEKVMANAGGVARAGFWLGPALAAVVLLLPPPATVSEHAHLLSAVAVLMAVWWMTEALPVAVTALLPLALFPFLGIATAGEVAPSYGNNLIWLFFGGFQLAFAIERCGLHRRLAMFMIRLLGTRSDLLVLGFMLAAALLSMWITNTSTTLMLLPVAMSVAGVMEKKDFGKALMLGVAHAASVGGIGTYIGTAPNGIFNQEAAARGIGMSFGHWMLFAAPLSLVLVCYIWFYLTRVDGKLERTPLGPDHPVRKSIRERPPAWSREEMAVAAVFAAAVVAWVGRRFAMDALGMDPGTVNDANVAIAVAVLLYVVRVPAGGGYSALLTWRETANTPWHILLLFGGGFALGAAFKTTGLSAWMGSALAEATLGWPLAFVILAIVLFITFLTEVTSNTATAIILMPVIGDLAVSANLDPLLLLLPATLAASCAFMLPVATPPNAIVYGSGWIRGTDMAKAGFGLNVGTGVLITLWTLTWGRVVL